MFNKQANATFKVHVTWTSGKTAVFPFITEVKYNDNGTMLLVGQDQTDGTMENRSYVIERKVVAFVDVRKIATNRTMNSSGNTASSEGSFAPEGADDNEPAF